MCLEYLPVLPHVARQEWEVVDNQHKINKKRTQLLCCQDVFKTPALRLDPAQIDLYDLRLRTKDSEKFFKIVHYVHCWRMVRQTEARLGSGRSSPFGLCFLSLSQHTLAASP